MSSYSPWFRISARCSQAGRRLRPGGNRLNDFAAYICEHAAETVVSLPERAIVALDRLPTGAKTVAVTPLDSFGNRGHSLKAEL